MVSFSPQSIFHIWKKTFKVPYRLHYTHQIKCSSLSSSRHSDTFLKGAKHDLYLHFFKDKWRKHCQWKSSFFLWCGLEISHCQLAEPLVLETHAVRYGIQGLGLDVLQVCGTTNGSQQFIMTEKRKTVYWSIANYMYIIKSLSSILARNLQLKISGFRIRIESGFNQVSGFGTGSVFGIRIQEGKNYPQKEEKIKKISCI